MKFVSIMRQLMFIRMNADSILYNEIKENTNPSTGEPVQPLNDNMDRVYLIQESVNDIIEELERAEEASDDKQ